MMLDSSSPRQRQEPKQRRTQQRQNHQNGGGGGGGSGGGFGGFDGGGGGTGGRQQQQRQRRQQNRQGRQRYHHVLASLDMYRKVPIDLLEGSQQGSVISWIAIIVMLTLFVRETGQFTTFKQETHLQLDNHNAPAVGGGGGRGQQQQQHSRYLRVDLNITMLDLRCEYATVNVVSVLGVQQNITKNLNRYTINEDGIQELYKHRNPDQHDIVTPPAWEQQRDEQDQRDSSDNNKRVLMHDPSVTQSLAQLHENGEDAISLDETTLLYALDDYKFVFVDYYASWCSHCRQLAPTWERLAEVMHDAMDDKNEEDHGREVLRQQFLDYSREEYEEASVLDIPAIIAKVDCVEHDDLCDQEGIVAYPTLILYVNGERYSRGEYYGDRTVTGFIQFLLLAEEQARKEEGGASQDEEEEDEEGSEKKIKDHAAAAVRKHLNMTTEHAQWHEAMERSRYHHAESLYNSEDHYGGCMLTGHILVDRVKGNFYIQARSASHDMDPRMTNLSHVIHHLSFHDHYRHGSKTAAKEAQQQFDAAPRGQQGGGGQGVGVTFPRDFARRVAPMNDNVYVVDNLHESYHHYLKMVTTNVHYYQILHSSQLAYYRSDHVPEAKFALDFSPIAVNYTVRRALTWYDYVTKILAILGGTFTVVGMIEAVSRRIAAMSSRRRNKQRMMMQNNSETSGSGNSANGGHYYQTQQQQQQGSGSRAAP